MTFSFTNHPGMLFARPYADPFYQWRRPIMSQQGGGAIVDADGSGKITIAPAATTEGNGLDASLRRRLDIKGHITNHHDFVGRNSQTPQCNSHHIRSGL